MREDRTFVKGQTVFLRQGRACVSLLRRLSRHITVYIHPRGLVESELRASSTSQKWRLPKNTKPALPWGHRP